MELRYIPAGDTAFIIKTGDEISGEINAAVRKILLRLENENIPGITDFIPSYNELMVCYDPSVTGFRELSSLLKSCTSGIDGADLPASPVIDVPVLYGGEYGPDIQFVADINKLSEDEVIEIHTSAVCLVYMLGFTPGFCYLGGLDPRIATPRRETPRLTIPAGAVGIAGSQTGIYPIDSPGGWQLIGRTPLRLFNPEHKPEFLFRAGDRIRFVSVTGEEYQDILEKVKNGTWEVTRSTNS
jgi:KipI family sensor histidine kinase inhibitor